MLGIYIHIPFCKRICNYCDFCKILYNHKYIDSYLDSLEKEIKDRYNGELVKTIYIGGGTPSSLNVDELEKLFKIIKIFNLDNDYEYTIECNIEDICHDKLRLMKANGINRVSVGIESFNKDIGIILGRYHDARTIFDHIKLVKEYFDNINIDLIYGVNDNLEIVKDDIAKFLTLDIPHISCYSLIIEEHTKLYIDKREYINEEIDNLMYEYIKNTLVNYGYRHYEISNYAKEGYESIHNKNYWLNGNYYGFGLGAVSYLDNYRISNTKNIHRYLDGKYQDKCNYENIKINKENDLILGLRLVEGIDIDRFNEKYHDVLLDKDIIKELIDDGYLEVRGHMLRCNDKYLYLENSILAKIIDSDL